MKIYNVINTAGFLDRLGKCEGRVYAVAPNGELQDIKKFAEEFRSFSWMGGRLNLTNEFELRFESPDDALNMLHFMAECNFSAA